MLLVSFSVFGAGDLLDLGRAEPRSAAPGGFSPNYVKRRVQPSGAITKQREYHCLSRLHLYVCGWGG